jgi:hypothetical protein
MQGLVVLAADLDQAYLLPMKEARGVHHAQACL